MWFVLRWLTAFALLAATYNPTSFNYVKWVMTQGERPRFADGSGGFAAVDRLHHLFAGHAALNWGLWHVAGARPCWGLAMGAL